VKFSGFKVHASTPNQEIVGAVRFDYSASHLSKLVHVYSDTQPFGLTFSDDKKTVTDTVTMLDAQHETRLDTMRATTTMRFHTFSNLLGGSLEVTTATPWSAWFDTYPDAGELSVAGANNSKASVRTESGRGDRVVVLLGGTTVDHYSLDGIGVLWTGAPWLPQVASADHYTIAFPSASSFRSLRQPDPAPFLPNGSLVWIYSRPLDPQSVTGATFIQTSGKNNTLFTPVPATVTIEGGLLTVRPSVQLVPGAGYELRVSGIGFSLRDTAGNTLGLPSFSGTVVQTISASLVATAPPVLLGTGAMLVLDASGSTANGAPVASTRWKQLSGPSLTFSDATAPRVTLSTAGTVNGITVVELEVANAAGEFDRKQISVTVAPDLANAHVITYRNGTGPVTIAGSIDPANPSGYVRQSQANSVLDVVLTPVRFLAGLSNGQTWQTGLKLTYGFGNTSGVTGGGWLGCGNSNTGNFSVLDYALDTSGNVARLAMDFDDTCGTTVTQGSIRYHSAIPVRQ
jgi:hypothetical protein